MDGPLVAAGWQDAARNASVDGRAEYLNAGQITLRTQRQSARKITVKMSS
jgi:hypothetical protein